MAYRPHGGGGGGGRNRFSSGHRPPPPPRPSHHSHHHHCHGHHSPRPRHYTSFDLTPKNIALFIVIVAVCYFLSKLC